MTYPVAATRDIAAPPEQVWGLVADLPRMGEWSPENQGGKWIKGATGPAVGALFRGRNKRGIRRWSTMAEVVDCEPGRAFEIAVNFGPTALLVANWRYEVEGAPGGCRVTESWHDHRTSWMRTVGRVMGDHSAAHTEVEMAATLANLAAAVEA
jgi:uncharacterized protein YndB with AHSA1/START domain